MKYNLILINIIMSGLILILGIQSSLAEEEKKIKYFVQLFVTSDDEALKSQVQSYLLRELRDLKDIKITDRDPADWKIIIRVYKINIKSKNAGIWLHCSFSEPFPIGIFDLLIKDKKIVTLLEKTAEGNEKILYEKYLVESEENLKKKCVELVAEFDSKIIEKQRKINEELIDKIKPPQTPLITK